LLCNLRNNSKRHSSLFDSHGLVLKQVAALTQAEIKWLADHLGHDTKIFENVYRRQDSTIEMAKISRLLMAVDSGQLSKFAGKSLDQIQFSGDTKRVNFVLDTM